MNHTIELLNGGMITHYPQWLEDSFATKLFATLRLELPLAQQPIRLFGKQVLQPRLTGWFGETPYTYSGTTNHPSPFTSTLQFLQERLRFGLHGTYNSVLANLYRDGKDHIGMHSDDEKELGETPSIASISFGISRRFLVQSKDGTDKREISLSHGSLIVMSDSMQKFYKHGIPKQSYVLGERLNLTFRNILKNT